MGYKVKNEAKYASGRGSLKNRIKYMEKTRPKYEINQEAFENKEIAMREAFGQSQEDVAAKTQLDQNVADTMAEVSKVSDSGSSILNTLSAINANKQKSYLGLANQEAARRSQKLGQLYRTNYALIDEKDKAFQYNVAAPYADQLTTLRDQKTQRTENWMRGADAVASIAASAVGTLG